MSRDSATRPRRRPGPRRVAGGLAVLGLLGLGTASASQLPLAGTAVSAGSAMIAPCQGTTPITVKFTSTWFTSTWQASYTGYRATHVQLTGLNGCSGRAYKFRVVTTTGVLAEQTGNVTTAGATDLEDIADTPVADIVRIELVIS